MASTNVTLAKAVKAYEALQAGEKDFLRARYHLAVSRTSQAPVLAAFLAIGAGDGTNRKTFATATGVTEKTAGCLYKSSALIVATGYRAGALTEEQAEIVLACKRLGDVASNSQIEHLIANPELLESMDPAKPLAILAECPKTDQRPSRSNGQDESQDESQEEGQEEGQDKSQDETPKASHASVVARGLAQLAGTVTKSGTLPEDHDELVKAMSAYMAAVKAVKKAAA